MEAEGPEDGHPTQMASGEERKRKELQEGGEEE